MRIRRRVPRGNRTFTQRLSRVGYDALGIDYEAVDCLRPDTAYVPNSGPTVASRTCMVVGRILQRCAEEMRARLGRLTPGDYLRQHGPLIVTKPGDTLRAHFHNDLMDMGSSIDWVPITHADYIPFVEMLQAEADARRKR